MKLEYDSNLVGLSVVVAVVASYATLELVLGLVRRRPFPWRIVFGGGVAFGVGIWSMRFLGMLAWQAPAPIYYDGLLTLLSFLLGTAGSILAVYLAVRIPTGKEWLEAAFIAAAICGMHYTGMAALRLEPGFTYDPYLVALSVLIAFMAAFGSLRIVAHLHRHGCGTVHWRQGVGAVLLGIAISGMHYTAMAATRFVHGFRSLASDNGWVLAEFAMKVGVGTGLLVILIMSLYIGLNRPRPSLWELLVLLTGAEFTLVLTQPVLLPGLSSLQAAILYAAILAGFLAPILYRLHRRQQEKLETQHTLRRQAEAQEVLNRLLARRLTGRMLQEVLDDSLETILQLSWLPLRPQGGIFLHRESDGVLELTATRNMAKPLLTLCREVPLGRCLCGRAALTRGIQHADCVDERHTNRFDGMAAHGHYNVPLLLDDRLLGVMVLYLEPGHAQVAEELEFLEAFGRTLALIIDRWQKGETIRQLAFYDPLTGLANRALLNDRFNVVMSQAQRAGKQFALLFLDLDHFKTINDALGHGQGDVVLRTTAKRLQRCIRESDTVARLGGDEFIVLLSTIEGSKDEMIDHVHVTAEKILDELGGPITLDDRAYRIGSSIGIATYPDDGADFEALQQAADTAMYHAKRNGRHRFQFYDDGMNAELCRRIEIESALRQALADKQMYLLYQPQFDVADDRIIGAEVLLRWRHPQRGELSPAEFIGIAEANGFIVDLGFWVLEQTCRQKAHWKRSGQCTEVKRLAVNISVRQLRTKNFVSRLEQILASSGIAPTELELELTESAFIRHNNPVLAANFDRLRTLGVRLAMDDFGTGYSSLGRLKHFPVDTLKIDRSFVRDLSVDPNDAAIVRAIVALGRTLNLRVLAEGVETEKQLAFLRQVGCDWYQGYYAARPLTADAFAEATAGDSVFMKTQVR